MLLKNHIFFLTKKRGVTRDLQIVFLSLSLSLQSVVVEENQGRYFADIQMKA